MSHWNHRIMRKRQSEDGTSILGIVEAFCDDQGLVWGVTADFQEPMVVESDGEGVEELKKTLHWMLEACEAPILDEDDIPEEGASHPFDIPSDEECDICDEESWEG